MSALKILYLLTNTQHRKCTHPHILTHKVSNTHVTNVLLKTFFPSLTLFVFLSDVVPGRSYSVNSCTPTDLETNRYTPIHGEFIPLQREQTNAGMQREATLMSVCSFRTDSRLSTNSNPSKMLNLGMCLLTC